MPGGAVTIPAGLRAGPARAAPAARATSLTTASLPSERSFGFLMSAAFALLAGYLLLRSAAVLAAGLAAGAALAFGLLALARPRMLAPLNRAWFALGQLLGRIVNPLVLGVIFFVVLSPVGLLTRAFGRDELRIRRRHAASYWIERTPHGPPGDSFKNQF
ncbi:MAG: hypothetical protein EOO54_09035 [Haliea sp.]|nr:MAG: hypothetical protein EOO54_09035 [Haliea sp.]